MSPTKDEIKDELDARGVDYDDDATKAELEELLGDADNGDGSTVEMIGNARVVQRPFEPLTPSHGHPSDPDFVRESNAKIER